ncbi:nucleoside deaminase [Rhodobacterales bacterium HKCCE2091]|nr:nucleoside deaminase [Rhodobacterales bacterium HKCCE2091]
MRDLVARAHEASAEAGKSGIAAGLMAGDTLLDAGTNHVHLEDDPTRHAEIVAIGRAAKDRGSPDLSGLTLLSTLQPCEMCLAAARFAGISRIVFAARQENVPEKYFAFPHLRMPDLLNGQDEVEVIGGVLEDEVIDLYRDGQE